MAAFDLDTATFLQSLNVGGVEAEIRGVTFKPDGTAMYIIGNSDNVHQYALSTAWDISSAALVTSLSISGANPNGIFFKPDGTSFYYCDASGETVDRYDMSTPWSIATATFHSAYDVTGDGENPTSVAFSEDGLKMYVILDAPDLVIEYDLDVAWSLTDTITNVNEVTPGAAPSSLYLVAGGGKLYWWDTSSDDLIGRTLSTPYDLSTASNADSLEGITDCNGAWFSPDGLYCYLARSVGSERVEQYSMVDSPVSFIPSCIIL